MHSSSVIKSMLLLVGLFAVSMPAVQAGDSSDMFIVRATNKSVEEVVKSVESFSNKQSWFYMGADTIMGGRVTLVKVCLPSVGRLILPQGMQYSAILPCGNLSVYKKNGKTEVSMLSANYMHALVPTKKMAEAVKTAEPLLGKLIAAAVS